jgi:hypothetical protein
MELGTVEGALGVAESFKIHLDMVSLRGLNRG